ncbi:MAG: CTP synthase [Chloroflexi bacterium]|nr:CTP synthase [Chloroflexota bacterium]
MTKYIFVTGGVVSGLGKGVTAAAIGRLLRSRGIAVAGQKLDPYLNVDPGTMSPYQHGEVFVTDDGAETDLDLGHYERFTSVNVTQSSNVTSGQIYAEVIGRERRGDYLGGTIQVIPHVTNEIKRRIGMVVRETNAEVVLIEVGGTVGDIEGLPFLEALRQMRKDAGRENTVYIHLTLLSHLGATDELKTKPTQHSVRELRGIGIQPDVICCRSDHPVDDAVRDKIALFCDVEPRAVIPLVTAKSIYDVPLTLEEAGLGDFLVERLNLETSPPDLKPWIELVERIHKPKPTVRVGLVGKYVALQDAYMSVREALFHAGLDRDHSIDIEWINSEDLERGRDKERLDRVHGIIVPGGFGYRGIEGKIIAAGYARQHKLPYLGLCLGMQVMCIELARLVYGSDEPNSTEFDQRTRYPVIDLMADQRDIVEKGGTMRLGLYPCQLQPGTRAKQAYQTDQVEERHRHRWEFNNTYRQILGNAGLIYSGLSPDAHLVEIVELADHPFMLGSQFHPEFKSRPAAAHPLFAAYITAVIERKESRPELKGIDTSLLETDS